MDYETPLFFYCCYFTFGIRQPSNIALMFGS